MVYSLAAIISFTSVSLILKSEVTPFSATNIYSKFLEKGTLQVAAALTLSIRNDSLSTVRLSKSKQWQS